ncbi:hypothetical protein D3C71_1879560 [compost metagenome]
MDQRGLGGDHHAANVDVDKGINVRKRHGLQRTAARNPGVIDQNIQPTERACRLRNGILNGLCAGAVCLNGFAVAPQRRYLCGDGLSFIGGFFIRNNHVGPGLSQG